MTRKDAARSLGISEAKFKKDMAKTGVRWASRPIHALQKRAEFIATHLAELRSQVEGGSGAGGGGVGGSGGWGDQTRPGYGHAPAKGVREGAGGVPFGGPRGESPSDAALPPQEGSTGRGSDSPLADSASDVGGGVPLPAARGVGASAATAAAVRAPAPAVAAAGVVAFPFASPPSSRAEAAIATLQKDLDTVHSMLRELKRNPHKYPRFKLEHLARWGPAERAFHKKYKK